MKAGGVRESLPHRKEVSETKMGLEGEHTGFRTLLATPRHFGTRK